MRNIIKQMFVWSMLLVMLGSLISATPPEIVTESEIEDLYVGEVPAYSENTYWKSERYDGSQKITFTILGKTTYENQEVYEAEYYEDDSKEKRTIFYITTDNLKILDPQLEEGNLEWELDLLNFPLYVGEKWNSKWRFQEFVDESVNEFDVSFDVVGVERYDYIIDEDLGVEDSAFKIKATIDERDYYYHFVPASGDFPGSNIMDVYEEFESRVGPRLREYGKREIPVTCDAYWEGYVYNSKLNECEKVGTSGCLDPFEYHTKEECEEANIQLSTVYAYLNQKFELYENQEAVVVDYNRMRVKLNNFVSVCVAATESTTTTTSTGGGGLGCRIAGAEVSVMMDSTKPHETSTGTEFYMEEGESKDVFGATLTFLGVDGKQGIFLVKKKELVGDFVDVEITPKENVITYGDEAYYEITITDRHPVAAIMCVQAPCPQPTHTYQIDVRNLPFMKTYEKKITLSAGESKTIGLKVAPYQVIEVKEEVTETKAIKAATSRAVQVAQPTTIKKPIYVSKLTKAAAPSVTTTEAVAIEETVQLIEEKPTVKVREMPAFHREYNFNVMVKLYNNPGVQDVAYAKLVIKPEVLAPPDFPTEEEVTLKLYRGWNLVSLPGKLVKFLPGTGSSKKVLGFVYLKDQKRYVTIQQAQSILGSKFKEYLAKNAFWIYSYENMDLRVEIDREISYSGNELKEGWNLVPITEDMFGGYLSDIVGDCNMEKLYLWDARNQEWTKITEDYLFSESQLYYGFIARVSKDCTMNGVTITVQEK